jgi:phosphoribosylamine--glycine ligase
VKVLLLGSGGREHALAHRLSQSPKVSKLFCAPGNPGIAALCELVEVSITSPEAVVAACRARGIELVVVGPEAPLVSGVVDALSKAGILAFGPTAGAARLEGSKAFAKEVMKAASVPTAESVVFESVEEAEAYAKSQPKLVVKADGLAAGKGVVVAQSPDEAVAAVRSLSLMGEAGKRLVLEEVLEGEEVSVIALCDGERYALFPPAQDHKRVADGDQGPNTGGMGAYVPAPFLSAAALDEVGKGVIAPMLAEMRRRGHVFRGALYAGLMLTAKGPRVLEFNCRLGDPEAQVLLMQLDEDLLPLLTACAQGKLEQTSLKFSTGASLGVVLAADGYPQSPKLGDAISLSGFPKKDVQLFHAGTSSQNGQLVTSGGRVMTVCARGSNLADARQRAYAAIADIRFRGMHFRRDIGAKALHP